MLTSLSYTMRGRPFVVVGLWITSMLLLVIASDLLVSCFPLTYVYHLASSEFSPDHLPCHYLARSFLLYHDLPRLLSISYHDWLLINITIVMLSLYTKHDTPVSYNYHDNGNVVPDYLLWFQLWFLLYIPVMYSSYDLTHSRNLIIMLKSYKKLQLVWVWEEVMDAGMISCL